MPDLRLTAAQKRRYARQLLLSEIGEAGQLRLASVRARLSAGADARASAVAVDYLARAGVEVASAASTGAELDVSVPDAGGIRALSGTSLLDEAAAALAGAFAAVETLKAALGVGVRAQLPAGLQLGAESLS